MKFNLIISGDRDVFGELGNAIAFSLLELGHSIASLLYLSEYNNFSLRKQLIQKDSIINLVIVGNMNVYGQFEWPISNGYNIIYVLEQWTNPNRICVREDYDKVFDLFYNNHLKYKSNSIYCPLGWSPAFETKLIKQKDIHDVFYFGGNTEYRMKFIERNSDKIYFQRRCFGDERDLKIVSSKINLMIKSERFYYFAPLHYLLIACKKGFVLSDTDKSSHPFIADKHFKLINRFDRDVEYFLQNEKERMDFAEAVYQDLKENFKFTNFLETAIKEI